VSRLRILDELYSLVLEKCYAHDIKSVTLQYKPINCRKDLICIETAHNRVAFLSNFDICIT
jgi:hypothetical protein